MDEGSYSVYKNLILLKRNNKARLAVRNKCAFVIFRLARPSYLRRRIVVKHSLESWKICLDGRLLSRFLASEHWPRLENNTEKDFYHCLDAIFVAAKSH